MEIRYFYTTMCNSYIGFRATALIERDGIKVSMVVMRIKEVNNV